MTDETSTTDDKPTVEETSAPVAETSEQSGDVDEPDEDDLAEEQSDEDGPGDDELDDDELVLESEATGFPGVARLGDGEGRAAAENLSAVCAELTRSGAHTAVKRLRDIDGIVDELPFQVIERLVAPERVLEELDEMHAQPVRRLHAWRNQAALLPLLITWVSLAVAVLFRDRSSEFFVPIFASVAFIDAVLILSVVVLTRLAHNKESDATREYAHVARHLDVAITSLALAVESQTMRTPVNSEQWAEAAGRVIKEAVRQTTELSEVNRQVVENAARAVEAAHTKADDIVAKLAEQSRATLQSLQQATQQIVDHVVREAVTVLRDTVAADRSLINEQLAPLVSQFQVSVENFTKNYSTYQESTATFVAVTADLGAATKILANSTQSYADIAGSIDAHLRSIEESQETFISQVTESVKSMATAADAMETMSTLLSDRLRADLEGIAAQLSTSSTQLSSVDSQLTGTTHALSDAARELNGAAGALARASGARKRWRFRRPGRKSARS